ncbi:PhzF family phenazine biosynthesis protein [Denitromonas iodatirespirans]|uniref:PhzF family phenazine biosynthesis protein n=1 Tax=Denitromonas iodatirespirans TaxID=2795389 RepID=A0A944DGE8_DENI1|nr:PhzF family phenazine biosynthesis protein [Denitromonas iodatirespirans]MBT0963853.1 PhzF family phenazine biosynthesis protein [Denitromonas iodatirespirans]
MKKHEPDTGLMQQVHIVSAFVHEGAGGNPAGVVLDADDLDEARMQAIAAEVGLSETAFVSRSATEGVKLDFFTPKRRIAHCGHATIATFTLLHALGRVSDGETSKETVDGPRRIVLADGAAYMEQLAPRYRPAADWAPAGVTLPQVLASLGLAAHQLDPRFAPQVVSTGNGFLLVGVRRGEDLAGLRLDVDAIADITERLDLIGYYVFTVDRAATAADATARMFMPRYGVDEESATGMAAGPLACVLYDFFAHGQAHVVIEQGRFMAPPSPSRIDVTLAIDGGRIRGLMAGGRGLRTGVRTLARSPSAEANA